MKRLNGMASIVLLALPWLVFGSFVLGVPMMAYGFAFWGVIASVVAAVTGYQDEAAR